MSHILFVHNGQERFVCDDLRLLQIHYSVTDWYQPGRLFNPVRLGRLVATHDLIFCWFASWHSLFPVLLAKWLHKPSVVVVGGYDVAHIPEADYGSQRGGLPRLVARTVIRHASRIAPFSESAKHEAIHNAEGDPRKMQVIYPFIEAPKHAILSRREAIVLTVGGLWMSNLRRKGLLPFVQAAARLPELTFIVAGEWFDSSIEVLKQYAAKNVRFTGKLSDAELEALYARASVYVQPSLHEGFGISVAEAMSMGCIPVVTRAGSLPEVVGDCGVYVESTEPDALAAAIRQALDSPDEMRQRAGNRIVVEFPRARRQSALQALIETILNDDHRKAADDR